MACCLFGTKPLPEPMQAYHYYLSGTIFSEISIELQQEFFYKKMNSKCRRQNGGHFVWALMCWFEDRCRPAIIYWQGVALW